MTVNAPVSGTIVELLANEEDTVTVGQDLFKIEAGASTFSPRVQQTYLPTLISYDKEHTTERTTFVNERRCAN